MDQQFVKWMAEFMEFAAGNMKLMEAVSGQMGSAPLPWLQAWPAMPGAPAAPLPPESMERFYREWLAMFGAVPLKDYQELKRRVDELEAQRELAGKAVNMLAKSMEGLKDAPEVMKPWMEFMDKAAKAQLEWFLGLGKVKDKPDGGEGNGP